MLIVNIMLYMNHVIHHIETPPGLTQPRLLAGGWEGKVLWVDRLNMMYHVVHIQSANFGFPKRTLLRGGGSLISYPGTEPKTPPCLLTVQMGGTFLLH
jgi:hypothetical protein